MPDYRLAAARAAKKYGVPVKVFLAQINQESGFNPHARSPAGAQGIAQFIPATAKSYNVNLADGRVSDDLEGAARYDRDLLKQSGGNITEALSAYNSGKLQGYKSIPETANYVRTILANSGQQTVPVGAGAAPRRGAPVSNPTRPAAPDTSGQRAALIQQFLSTKGASPVDLALSIRALNQQQKPVSTPSPSSRVPHASQPTSSGQPANVSDVLAMTGTTQFDGKPVAAWVGHVLSYARQHGWQGGLSSGYRTDAEQTRIYQSGVRPAAVPKSMGGGGSNHEGTRYPLGAADVTNAGQLSAILKRSPYASILQYAGSKDRVHFSHPHGGSY